MWSPISGWPQSHRSILQDQLLLRNMVGVPDFNSHQRLLEERVTANENLLIWKGLDVVLVCVPEKVIETQIEKHGLQQELTKKLQYVLLLRPKHHTTRSQLQVLLEMGLGSCSGA